MSKRFRKIIKWIPVLVWMGFIFYLSSQSTIGIGKTKTSRFLILKTFHLIEYGVLFLLVWWAQNNPIRSFGISYLYALSDELHQSFVTGREGRIRDTLIDFLGMVLAFFLVKMLSRIPLVKQYWNDLMRIKSGD